MMIFAGWIEHALDVSVQRPHKTDAREHRRPAKCRDRDQGFHRRPPFRCRVFRLRQFGDVGAGVLQRSSR
jgi:hypothetical protein